MYLALFLILLAIMVLADLYAIYTLRQEDANYRDYLRWTLIIYPIVVVFWIFGGAAWGALAFMGVNAYMAVDSSRRVTRHTKNLE